MARAFRYLYRSFLILGAVALLAVALIYYLASQSLPDYDANWKAKGTLGAIEIVRDSHAVPHISAEHELDVFYGLGFAHAQDRLWQMTLLRRTAQGRLSEMFGEATLKVDRLLRALDVYNVARANVEVQTPEVQAALEAYSAGVNGWLHIVAEEALGRGAPEFLLFSKEIAPWTPADSLAILRIMALQLTDQAAREVMRAKLALRLSDARLQDIYPDNPGPPIMEVPEFAAMFNTPATLAEPERHALSPLKKIGMAGASNAWAARSGRVAGGGTLLASDPHLGLSAPSIWMLARLELEDGGVIGGTIPGVPGILVGRNAQVGWGLTTAYLDDQDIYIEKLNPDNPEQYLTPDGYKDFESTRVLIEIDGAPAITQTLRRTRHGPVVPNDHFGLDGFLAEGQVAALSWTALDPSDKSIEALFDVMRAKDAQDLRAATRLYSMPPQVITYADKSSIGLQAIGVAPRRKASSQSQGRLPSPGWVTENDWDGWLPFDTNPNSFNPSSGIVVNTNNRLVDRPFPNHFSHSWGDSQRIQRAMKMLNGREFHTLDSFIEIQSDTVSNAARTLLPLIAKDLWWTGEPAATGTQEHQRQQALERLAKWNGEMSEHDPEPLIYAAWVRALQRRIAIDELGALADEMHKLNPLFIERVFRDIDGAKIWCDVIQTSASETCTDISRLALDEALIFLSERYGEKLESWRWGDAHQAYHKHEVLGNIPLLSWFVNIVQDTPGGDNTLLRGRTMGKGDTPFRNVHGSGFRGVYDFNDPDSSVFIISTGQSGHPLSRHYDDLSRLWRRSEYVPMSLNPELARGGAVGITRISPKADEN